MKNIKGNLFDYIGRVDAICITTNDYIKKSNNRAVMGRGCAKTATTLWPDIDLLLGNHIKNNGNIVGKLLFDKSWLISFPVKSISETFTGENVVKHMKSELPSDG